MHLHRIRESADEALERRIVEAREKFSLFPSRLNWVALTLLIRQRSPEQVERMEREKGLR